MRYLIDGYNLLFSLLMPDEKIEEYREALINILLKETKQRNIKLTLVFDAHKSREESCRTHRGSLEIVYTQFGQTADAYILQNLSKETIVVTSDKQLQRHIKNSGYQTISNMAFIKLMKPKKIENDPKSSMQLQSKLFEYYLNAFESRLDPD